MTQEARHQWRREQIALLFAYQEDDPPAGGETLVDPIQPSAWHVVVMMMSIAHTVDHLDGQPGGRLLKARGRALALLQASGEPDAEAMLDTALNTILSSGHQVSPDQPDPQVCLDWLALLEEEVEYLHHDMQA